MSNDQPSQPPPFASFFHEAVQYPDPAAYDLTNPGWRFDYISSTFLDGWINYVKPMRAYVVSRYAEDFAKVKAKLAEWEAKPPFHTQLGELGDDVYVLAQDKSGKLWLFEFDCDTSDCSIGVLDADGIPTERVIESFDAHVRERALNCQNSYGGTGDALLIDVALIRGWVKFK